MKWKITGKLIESVEQTISFDCEIITLGYIYVKSNINNVLLIRNLCTSIDDT